MQDIKSPNVLLSANFTAKIADVGLAKLQNKDYLSAQQTVGTFTWSVRAFSCLPQTQHPPAPVKKDPTPVARTHARLTFRNVCSSFVDLGHGKGHSDVRVRTQA